MSCTVTSLGNIGFKPYCDHGYLLGIGLMPVQSTMTFTTAQLQATWDTLRKQTDNRLQFFPADLAEITQDSKVSETLAGGRENKRFIDAGSMILRADRMPTSVMREMAQNYDGATMYAVAIYSKNFALGRKNGTTFEFKEVTTSFYSEWASEEAAQKGVIEIVSNDAEGDQQNIADVSLGFSAKSVLITKSLRDGAFVEYAGSDITNLKFQLTDAATGLGVVISTADLTSLATDLLITDSGDASEAITAVTAITGAGIPDGVINVQLTLGGADTYTISMKEVADRASTSFPLYDFAVTTIDITVA